MGVEDVVWEVLQADHLRLSKILTSDKMAALTNFKIKTDMFSYAEAYADRRQYVTANETGLLDRRDRVLKEAFGYREALLTQAFVMLRDWAGAEDVVQDAFLVVMNKFEDFQNGTSVYAWTRQIVRNKALAALRKRGKEQPMEEDALDLAVERAAADYLTEERAEILRERHRALEDCISGLRHPMVEILVGFYWRMESCESLAQTYKRSANAIRLTLSRMRHDLKRCVERRMRESGVRP